MRLLVILLTVILTAEPAFAQAAAGEQSGGPSSVGKRFWSGVAMLVGGSTMAILAGTPLKSEDYTSGNTPADAYAQCVALKSNPVYAGNQCDVLESANQKILWSGVGVAALGVTLMAFGSPHSSIEFGPAGVRVVYRRRF